MQVLAVNPHDRLLDAMLRMSNESIRHLVVVDGDRWVGIVSLRDVVWRVIQDAKASFVTVYLYVTLLAAAVRLRDRRCSWGEWYDVAWTGNLLCWRAPLMFRRADAVLQIDIAVRRAVAKVPLPQCRWTLRTWPGTSLDRIDLRCAQFTS